MTDQDRGAYTPQTDAPLAFDARRSGGGGGGPAPMTLIVSAVVLLLLIIALLLFYRSGVRTAGQAPQVVGAPVGQTKTAAASPDAAASGAPSSLQVYKAEESAAPASAAPVSAAPTFAPPPEQPALRAAVQPGPAPVASHTAPVTSAPLRPAQTETAPPPPAPAKIAAAPAKPVKLAAAPAIKPKKAEVVQAPTAGEPLVQIGAFSSQRLAEKGWSDTAVVLPGKMAGKTQKVEMADRDGKTFYRAFVGGFSSHADAVSFCVALKAAGKACMVR